MAVNPELFLKSFQIFGENRRENVRSNIALGTFQRQARVEDEAWDWYQRYKDGGDVDYNNALRDIVAFEMNQLENNDLERIPGPPAAPTATASTATEQPRPDGTPSSATAGQPSSPAVVTSPTAEGVITQPQAAATITADERRARLQRIFFTPPDHSGAAPATSTDEAARQSWLRTSTTRIDENGVMQIDRLAPTLAGTVGTPAGDAHPSPYPPPPDPGDDYNVDAQGNVTLKPGRTAPSIKGRKGVTKGGDAAAAPNVVKATLTTGLAVRDENGNVIPMHTSARQVIDIDLSRIVETADGPRVFSPTLGGTVILRGLKYEAPAAAADGATAALTGTGVATATERALQELGVTELDEVVVTATRDNTVEGLVDMSGATPGPGQAAQEGAQRAAYSPVRMNPTLQGLVTSRRAAEQELMDAARRAQGNAASFANELRSISSRYRGIPTQMLIKAWDAAMNAPPVTLTGPFSGLTIPGRTDRLQQTMNVVDHVQRVSNERTKNQLEAARLEAAAREVEIGAETAYLKLRHANTVDQQAAFEKAQTAMEALVSRYAMSGTNVEIPSTELMKVQQILATAGIETTDLNEVFDTLLEVRDGKYYVDPGFMQEVSDSVIPRAAGTFRAAGEAYVMTGVVDPEFEDNILTEDERNAAAAARSGQAINPAMLQAIGSKYNAYKGGRTLMIDNITEENRFVTTLSETLQAAGLHSALAWNGTTYDYNTFNSHVARVDAAFTDQTMLNSLDEDERSMYDRAMAMAYRTHRGMAPEMIRQQARTYLSMAKSYLLNELNRAAASNNGNGYTGFTGTGSGTGSGAAPTSGDRDMQEQIGLERIIQNLGNITNIDETRMAWYRNLNPTTFDNATKLWEEANKIFKMYPEASRANNANFRSAVRQIREQFNAMSGNTHFLFMNLPTSDVQNLFLGGQPLTSSNIGEAYENFEEWLSKDPNGRERFLERLIGRYNPGYDKYVGEPSTALQNDPARRASYNGGPGRMDVGGSMLRPPANAVTQEAGERLYTAAFTALRPQVEALVQEAGNNNLHPKDRQRRILAMIEAYYKQHPNERNQSVVTKLYTTIYDMVPGPLQNAADAAAAVGSWWNRFINQ